MKPKFFVTTPIYYVNGAPHIGHAYTNVAADVMARFKRLDGHHVFFLTGTDEHGQKVEKAAAEAGMAALTYVDGISARFRDLTTLLGLSNDDFIRTTEARHIRSCQELWRRVAAAGDIYLGHYEGWYAVRDEAFYGEDELRVMPDGSRIAPTGVPVEWVREPSYFFKLSEWSERLLAFYEEHPDFLAPVSTRNEVISFVKGGMHDLSVSRTSFKWGIPVPDDAAHVMYVWFDALTNYLTATGFPDERAERAGFWPPDLHMVGKEITRFHCVYWPAFLLSAGLRPPKRVFANGWMTVDGQKMGKSMGNAIDPWALVARYGLDPLRFFLMREIPFGQDGDFSPRALVQRLNGELANELGNLAQRSLSLVARHCEGRMPSRGAATEDDATLLALAEALPLRLRTALGRQAMGEALEATWQVVRAANAYIDRQAPWTLAKTDRARMAAVLRVLADVLRALATVLQPFMPGSMARMLDQLGVAPDQRDLADLANPVPDATVLPAPSPVFPRFVDEDRGAD
ncbi:MAG: methionine--tRNA ligase [Rhodospirillales bacterium]|nr:methionine--tRNA ligase [Rhodospirillales bacterium]